MNLYLCGGGSGKQIEKAYNHFYKKINKTKPILYIPLAMKDTKYNDCYKCFKEEIKYLKLDKFEMVTSSLELSKKDLNNYSSIFIGGGNTYKLLKEIKENSNDKKIIDYLNNDGTIF